jgi:CMP-N-acetylneuraminic acid synthetase
MTQGARVAAIIPAKAFSRRVPNKNMRLFHGKPLIAHTIEQALASEMIDDVFVSTDDAGIGNLSECLGARVPFLRPPELAADHVHGSVPVLEMLERLGGTAAYDYCVNLLPTSPLRKARSIDGVVRLAIERQTNVLSVTPSGRNSFHFRLLSESGELRPLMPEHVGLFNVQGGDLPEVYYLNPVAQCAPVDALLRHRTFQYGAPLAFPTDPIEAVDIDTEMDFEIAEALATLVGFARTT